MYRVTITRIDKNVPFKDKEYKRVGEDEDGEPKYDYVYFENVRDETTEIYEQTVEDLKVSDVVAIVNSIGGK